MDPFSEIDGIVEAKEEEISVKDSTLFKGKEEEGEELPYLDRFPRRLHGKANSDLKKRLEMEQAFQAAMVELHNVREQLYLVRFDDLRETEQLRKEVQNYLSEIERLDAKVGKLKEKMMDSYLKTLNLEQIQMTVPQRKNPPKPSGSTGYDRKKSEGSIASKDKYGRAMSRHDLEVTGNAPLQQQSPGLEVSSTNEESLLRKYSFGLLKVKSTQTGSPKASYLTPEGAIDDLGLMDLERRTKLSSDEIATIRATLYNLRQKKELTGAEENLVDVLTNKLRMVSE